MVNPFYLRITKLGSQIRFVDGREATVVYNGLDGVGIKWGLHNPNPDDFKGTTGGLFNDSVPDDWPWKPDALLREPYENCDIECIPDDFEILRIGVDVER